MMTRIPLLAAAVLLGTTVIAQQQSQPPSPPQLGRGQQQASAPQGPRIYIPRG